jgi:glycosyltransferase involved in cell wall biosynthesis
MKILLVAGIYPPDVGGPATFLPQLAAYCQRSGHQVKVLTLSENSEASHTPSCWRVIRIPRRLPLPIRFSLTTVLVFVNSILGYRVFANGLHEECGLALWLSRGKGVAKIVGDPVWERATNKLKTKMDIESFNSAQLPWNIAIQRRLLKFGLNQFHTVITPSQQLQDFVVRWRVKSNLEVVPNGVPIKNLIKQDKPIDVITVCRLVKWKNVDLLIESSNKYGYSLCIVGDGPEQSKLALAANGNSKIGLHGRLSQDEVDELLSSSKVFALISDYEGLSFSLLQAMSYGLPVVVSNTSGNADVVKRAGNGLIVDTKATELIGSSIQSLLEDKKLMQELSSKSLRSIKDYYNIEICLEKTTQTLAV